MTLKKLLIILSFTVTGVIIMLLSTSYAWYQFDNAYTSFNNVETFEEDLDLAVIFTNDDNISTVVGVPLTSAQVAEYSEKTRFTITPSSTSALGNIEVAFQIALVNLNIDPALTAVTDLRYSLIQTIGNGTATEVASGNFSGVTDDTLIIKPMASITNLDTTYSYEFRLWLHETGGDQNSLMGKKISGKIKVSTAIR